MLIDGQHNKVHPVVTPVSQIGNTHDTTAIASGALVSGGRGLQSSFDFTTSHDAKHVATTSADFDNSLMKRTTDTKATQIINGNQRQGHRPDDRDVQQTMVRGTGYGSNVMENSLEGGSGDLGQRQASNGYATQDDSSTMVPSTPVRATYADLYAETGLPSPRPSQSRDTATLSQATSAVNTQNVQIDNTRTRNGKIQLAQLEVPLNADALLVQKTYARIDEIGGIPRDGFVEGEELTRERRTQASINGYLDPISLASSWGPSTSTAVEENRNQLSLPNTARRKSEGASTSLLSVNTAPSQNDITRSRKASAASRAASHKSPQEEAAELRLLEKVDRYGFFTPSHLTTTSGRLVLLPKEPCSDIPKTLSINGKAKGKQRSVSGGNNTKGALASPYIHVSSMNSATHASRNGSATPQDRSRQSSLAPPSPNMSASTSLSSISSQAGLTMSQPASSGPKEPERIMKWFDEMLVPARRDQGGNVIAWTFSDKMTRNDRKLQRRIRKGIPDRWRLAAWEALLLRMQGKTQKGRDLQSLERQFYELILKPCQHDVQIDLDVPRTISGHLMFHTRYGLGQRSLFNVLHAFAMLCHDCGYCQGMGSLAATFLCYAPPEKAYAYMVYLHDSYDMHTIFEPGFPGMLECFHIQEQLVKQLMPNVHDIFEKNFISISSFATKWYITMFVNVLPFSTQLRVWDLFLLWGKDALVLTSTAIIWTLRHHLSQPSTDFEKILSLLSSYFVPADEDAFVRWIGKMVRRDDVKRSIDIAKAEYTRQSRK